MLSGIGQGSVLSQMARTGREHVALYPDGHSVGHLAYLQGVATVGIGERQGLEPRANLRRTIFLSSFVEYQGLRTVLSQQIRRLHCSEPSADSGRKLFFGQMAADDVSG